jgi:type I restriction enzyme S subunit
MSSQNGTTKANNLPDGWSVGTMADVVAEIVAGTSVVCDDREFRSGDKRVLKLSAVSKGRFDERECKIASLSEHPRLRTPVRAGTVLFTRKNTPDLVGDSALVTASSAELYLPDLIWELSPKDGINASWMNCWLQSPEFRKQVARLCAGSSQTMVGISQDALMDSPVSIPPGTEQDRIVAVLGTWDEAIDSAERLIDARERRYRGLLQRLIGPAFSEQPCGDWKQCKLGEVFVERDERSPDLQLLAITGEHGVVMRDELDRRQTASEDKSKYKVIRPNDIGYNTMRMWQGVFGRSAYTGIVSPAYTVITAIEGAIDTIFASHLFAHPKAISLFFRYSQGLVDDTLMLKFPHFSEVSMRLPGIQTQRKYGAALEEEATLILQEKQHLSQLRSQKRGLVQRLLNGEWTLGKHFDRITTPRQTVGGK